MASQFYLSLTAFSLLFSSNVLAEQFSVSNGPSSDQSTVKIISKDEERKAAPQEVSESRKPKPQKKADPKVEKSSHQTKAELSLDEKKLKPHYVGVRKPKPKAPGKKKTSKIKTEWFSSKTHPKVAKKDNTKVELIETSSELPEERPFYVRNAQLNSDNSRIPYITINADSSNYEDTQLLTEGERYPQPGFQAPNGHVYVTGEYLLWRTRQEGMEYATAKQVKFEFNSGFRVGLGVHMPYDGWDVYVNYTNFSPEQSNNAHGSLYPLFLFEGAGTQGSSVSSAHAHWKIEYQAIDVEFGRVYFIAKSLTLRPFFGLKGTWIDQHSRIRYSGGYIPAGQEFRTHFENDFKGAGPLVGIEANWQLGMGLSLFGDVASALVVGHFDNEQHQYQLDDAEVVHLDNPFNLVSPFLQLMAGVAWDRNFYHDRCHLGLSAGFETQYWWSQNQIEQFTDKDFPIYVREKGDLAFYGLTLRARVDF